MFKPGDKVVCVRADNTYIKLNRIYTIEVINTGLSIHDNILEVIVSEDITHYHHKNCFASLKEIRKQKLNKIHNA